MPSVQAVAYISGRDSLADNLGEHALLIVLYVLLTSWFAFAAGYGPIGKVVRIGAYRNVLRHTWVYDLVPDQHPRKKRRWWNTWLPGWGKDEGDEIETTLAFLMTNVQDGQQVLGYAGWLQHFGLEPDGSFAYFVLLKPGKFYVKLGERPTAEDPVKIDQKEGHALPLLYVSGETVSNVVFHRYGLSQVPRADEQDDLKTWFRKELADFAKTLASPPAPPPPPPTA